MAPSLTLAQAAALLTKGGVIAYPTEAVWGLGCDPGDEVAVMRLLAAKRREVGKGVILIASSVAQLAPYADFTALSPTQHADVLATWPGPHTWVIPAAAAAPRWIIGDHNGIAVRVSAHPVVIALCNAFDGAIVSTSANTAHAAPARSVDELAPDLLAAIDGILAGSTTGQDRPSQIRDARSGRILRA